MYNAHTLATAALLASDLLVLHDPASDFSNKDGKFFALPGLSWTNIKWALDLSMNLRGIGWNFEAKHLWTSMGKNESRLRFTLRQLLGMAGCLLVMDLAQTLYRNRSACYTGGSVYQDGMAWQVVYNLAEWINMGGAMLLMHALAAAVTVPLFIYKQEDWPDMFGRIRDGYTVRKFWGRTWHQLHRHFLTAHAKFFAQDVLGLTRGKKLTTYVELLIVFFISGIVHASGAYAFLRTWSGAFDSILFFTLQAVCIACEDHVIIIGKRLGLKDTMWTRLIGYAWVVTWITLSNPIRAESLVHGGLWDQSDQPQLGLVQGVIEKSGVVTFPQRRILHAE
ncbi:hypothetical protein DACRYDRAFT_61705 [Dacryopinax primogenitus]|uniref:Wax synthase domain-containing protein n=1 Tax=Dacryopinax primogenitus (strain DJM 731) TaxID=1858805 RepID=M5G947_DACPD|nr:uncharacterized protein DACRYDRAFT_61705 [Dacryopinax primogenitus]EJU05269.1 hypothetical protein DACRYDRAFT_61705 [Dacryopinax primogenitus]